MTDRRAERAGTIGRKFTWLLVFATLLPVLVATTAGYLGGQRLLEAEAESLLGARAEQLVSEIDSFQRWRLDEAERIARMPRLAQYCEAPATERAGHAADVDQILRAFAEGDPAIRAISLLGTDAKILRSSEAGLVGFDLSVRGYARTVLGGSAVVSDILIPAPKGEKSPAIVYAVPLRDAGGRVSCAVVLGVRADALWQTVRAGNGRAGEGSFSLMVDRLGIRIAHSFNQDHVFRPSRSLEPAERQALLADRRFAERTEELVAAVLPAPELAERGRAPELGQLGRVFHTFSASNGEMNLAVARRLTTVPWTLFVLVPERSVNRAGRELGVQSAAGGALISALALGVGLLFVRSVRRPFRELAQVTRALGEGKLDARAPAGKRDELGELGALLNQMAEAIQQATEQLEERVADRTRELGQANAELEAQRTELLAQREELLAAQQGLLAQQHELEEKNRQVEQATRLKSEFLANMSHELRTPLNAIIGFSDLLLTPGAEPALSAKQATRVGHVLESGRHLLELINDILDLSKIEAGRMELELTEFEVGSAIAEALELVGPAAAKKQMALRTVGVAPLAVRADRAKLRQILLNLLSNAVKFSPEGGEIEVGVRAVEGAVELSVKDAGPGIPDDFRARLFEPFAQAESPLVKRHGGTGLGLAITKRLVEAHGGTIEVASEPGKGATFRVSLPSEATGPLRLRAASTPAELASRIAGLAARTPGASDLVVVIDDEPAVAEILTSLLEPAGLRVEGATTGRSGLEVARREKPALMIVDLDLPDISGFEVVDQLAADASLRAIPILVLTGIDITPQQRSFLKTRARAIAQKGDLTSSELLAAVRRATGRPASVPPAAGAARVLIVDDHDLNRELAHELVESLGYSALDAAGADEGIAAARRDLPAAVLMDLSMPGKDGFAALAELRAAPATAAIPVVALTAHAMRGDEEAALAAGFDGYLSKPIDAEKLRALLSRLLRARAGV